MNLPNRDCLTPVELSRLTEPDSNIDAQSAVHLAACSDCQTRLDELTNTSRLEPYLAVTRSNKFQESYFGSQANAEHGINALRIPRYEIESVIGAGGMGVVYRAADSELDRNVAIKVLTNVDSATGLARFERESHALSRLSHANVVPIYTSGKADDGRPYLIMPLIEGHSLKEVLQREPLEPVAVAQWISQVAHGLEAAHQQNLVHRDVKPANILIDAHDNLAKVVDFGLVRSEEDSTLTRTHMICGTPEYMSPEQADNLEQADLRSDIYSLGVTLYECLTGSVPFRGRPLDVLKQHQESEPIPPRRLNQTIPVDLQTICLKAMEKDPQLRYASAAALADDLDRLVDGRAISARPVGPVGRAWRWSLRNQALALASTLGLAALIAGSITSTVLWMKSAQNAYLAEQRNQSLLANQNTLKSNLTSLKQSIQGSRRDHLDDRNQFWQMPTSIRNTMLISMRQSWELLFVTAANDPESLRQMIDDLIETSEFALAQGMELRSVELTDLNLRVVTRLLELKSTDAAGDFLRAARVHNQFADARQSLATLDTTQFEQAVEASLHEAKHMAKLATEHASPNRNDIVEMAAVESFFADNGLIQSDANLDRESKAERLIALAELVESKDKHDASMQRWLELQQMLSKEIARVVPIEKAIEYRDQRSEQFARLIKWNQGRGRTFDVWNQRRLAVNGVLQGVLYERIDDNQQARETWIKSLESMTSILTVYPLSNQVRADEFETLLLVANLDWKTEQRSEAIEWYGKALRQIHVLVQLNPNDHVLARRGAHVHELVGKRYSESGLDATAAEAFYRGATLALAAQNSKNALSGSGAAGQPLSQRLLELAADAYAAADMPKRATAVREQLDELVSE